VGTRAEDTISAARELVNAFDPDRQAKVEPKATFEPTPWEPVPAEPHQYSVRIQRLIDDGTIKVDEYNRII
jgi:hypothetical protein